MAKEGETTPIPGGCHPTRDEANAHLDALYANEPQASGAAPLLVTITRPAAAHACGCVEPTSCACSSHEAPGIPRQARQARVATAPFSDPFPAPEYAPPEWMEPDAEWLEPWRQTNGYGPSRDETTGILRLTVTDEGRVGGFFYEEGVCIVDETATRQPGDHECWQPPPSPTDYARFHQQDVVVASGQVRLAGVVGNVGGHASPFASLSAASRHYADPNAQMFVCRAYDVETPRRGGYLAGALLPGLTFGDVALLRRSALSGDWRWFAPDEIQPRGGYDCLGPTLVTRPGLALVRAFRVAGAHPVYLGGSGGVAIADDPGEVRDGKIVSLYAPHRPPTAGGTMPPTVRLPDGTTIDFEHPPVGATLVEGAPPAPEGNGAAHVAAPDDAPPPPPAAEEENGGDVEGRIGRLEERVSAIEGMLEELVEMGRAAAAAALDEVEDRLPAMPEPVAAQAS